MTTPPTFLHSTFYILPFLKRPTPTGCIPSNPDHNSEPDFFPPSLRGEKNLSGPRRYQPVRSGTTGVFQLWTLGFGLWTQHSNHQLFSPGPITRQYPAISGNKRTRAQFLAAYCRLSVRLLPRILRLVRICSPSRPREGWHVAVPNIGPGPRTSRPEPFLRCQRTCPRCHKCSASAKMRKSPNFSGLSSSFPSCSDLGPHTPSLAPPVIFQIFALSTRLWTIHHASHQFPCPTKIEASG